MILEKVLSYLLSFSDGIETVVTWGIDHPAAGMFFGSLVLNLVYKFLPASGFGMDLIDIVIDAGRKAYGRKQ